eukprot:Nk52_evm13s252 gene=Nk52_evmTU13s252
MSGERVREPAAAGSDEVEGVGDYDKLGFPLQLSFEELKNSESSGKSDKKAKAHFENWKTWYLAHINQIPVFETPGKPPFYLKFVQLVRGGIPEEYRSEIWQKCAGSFGKLRLERGVYKGLIDQYRSINEYNGRDSVPSFALEGFTSEEMGQLVRSKREICLDLTRTFPKHRDFRRQDSELVNKLRNILQAYSLYNQKVGYCQGMSFIAGFALLILKEEEEVFWLLSAIVEDYLRDYHTPCLAGNHVDQLILTRLIALQLPEIHSHFEKLRLNISLVTMQWFFTLFAVCCPPETTLRIWDCFFAEGRAVLFRVVINMLSMKEKEILGERDMETAFGLIRTIPSQIYDFEKLLKPCPWEANASLASSSRNSSSKFEESRENKAHLLASPSGQSRKSVGSVMKGHFRKLFKGNDEKPVPESESCAMLSDAEVEESLISPSSPPSLPHVYQYVLKRAEEILLHSDHASSSGEKIPKKFSKLFSKSKLLMNELGTDVVAELESLPTVARLVNEEVATSSPGRTRGHPEFEGV